MLNRVRKINSYRKMFKNPPRYAYRAIRADSAADIVAAQRLHAAVYVDRKYNSTNDLTKKGTFKESADPFKSHSDYFCLYEGRGSKRRLVAAARQIVMHPRKRYKSYQTYIDHDLYHVQRQAIDRLDPGSIVEISGLVKEPGQSTYVTLLLYRTMWQHSVKSGHSLWLMSCDTQLFKRLKLLFNDALIQVGDEVYYKGHNVIPAALEIEHSLDVLLADTKSINPLKKALKRDIIDFFLRGLPVRYLKMTHVKKLNDLNILEDKH